MSWDSTKLRDGIKNRIPIIFGAGTWLDQLLTWREANPPLPSPEKGFLCMLCQRNLLAEAIDRHNAGEGTGLVWLWSENLSCERKVDFPKIEYLNHKTLTLLKFVVGVTSVVYCIDQQAYICQECIEAHVRRVHEIYGVPYEEPRHREAVSVLSSAGRAEESADSVLVDRSDSPERDADRVAAPDEGSSVLPSS